jgi:hypothetical protein
MPPVEGQGRKILMILRVPQMAGADFSTSASPSDMDSFAISQRNPYLRVRLRLRGLVL